MYTKRRNTKAKSHKKLIPLMLIMAMLLVTYLFILGNSKEQTNLTKANLTPESQKVHFLATCQKIEAFQQQKGFYPDSDQMAELTANSDLHYRLINQDTFELQLQNEQANLVYRSDIDKINQLIEQKTRNETR